MKYFLFFLSVFLIFSCNVPDRPFHHSKVFIQQHWEHPYQTTTITYDTINIIYESELTLYAGSLAENNGDRIIASNVSYFSILSDSIILIKR